MRVMIQLEKDTLSKVDSIAKRDGLSRAAFIRLVLMRFVADKEYYALVELHDIETHKKGKATA